MVGGGWVVESEHSDQLWLSFSLALAKPNNRNESDPSANKPTVLFFIYP